MIMIVRSGHKNYTTPQTLRTKVATGMFYTAFEGVSSLKKSLKVLFIELIIIESLSVVRYCICVTLVANYCVAFTLIGKKHSPGHFCSCCNNSIIYSSSVNRQVKIRSDVVFSLGVS